MKIKQALEQMNFSPETIEKFIADGKISLGYFNSWTNEMKENYLSLWNLINRDLPIEKKNVARCVEEKTFFVSDDCLTAQVFYGSDSSD
jgi:hypothetical protein